MSEKIFECKMCGECCKGKGGIYLESFEIERISKYLSVSTESFIIDYCEEVNGKKRLKISEKGCCVFFDEVQKCKVHSVKPEICKLWPFFKANVEDETSFYIAKLSCPGINKSCTHREFVRGVTFVKTKGT